jgi:adenine deaminase
MPVIGVTAGSIVTQRLQMPIVARNGARVADVANDVLKVAVLARHGVNRNVGRGFVKGMGLARGALASSVGHDSHNVCVIGTNDADMAVAVNRLIALQGGFVAASDGAVRAELALPVAGLMNPGRFEEVERGLKGLRTAVRALGCTLPEPFLQLAFLALPVIPHLKITDRGLVDVEQVRADRGLKRCARLRRRRRRS